MHPASSFAAFRGWFLPFLAILVLSTGGWATTLRVVAWNIEWFPGQQRLDATHEMERGHMERVQKRLKEMAPDIFLASEIRDWKSFEELVSVVPDLRVHVVSSFRDRDTGGLWPQQLAIASRLPVRAAWFEPWRPTMWGNPRGFSFAALEDPGSNGLILVYSLHLKSNRSFNEEMAQTNFRHRNESIRQLLLHIEEMETIVFAGQVTGVIVGGDINTCHDGRFGDRVVEMMVEAGFRNTWAETPREERLTWRGSDRFPPTTFDYIFVRGLPSGRARMMEVAPDESDHHAVGLLLQR
ncbi:MAG: endonuclease/exonuclease/phosphatase family protein [Opitutales bacterium]|nr:endonuclease/exonuclease/phosphatase family protein [Opitutales bacterium]